MSKASVYKTRKQYESVRKNKLAMPVCQHCGRWGSYQEDNEAYDSAGVPLACVYPSLDRVSDYELGLSMDEYHVFSHRLHTSLGVAECGDACEIPNEKPKSTSLIKSVKSKLKVEDIAERLTELRSSGNKLNGRCPLHNEQKGRSFYVWLDTQSWYCFGQCVRGGDVLDLIEEAHELGLNWRSGDGK